MRRTVLALLIAMPACQGTSAELDKAAQWATDCTALLMAEPHEWQARVQLVHGHGPAASQALLAALIEHPSAVGAQAAIALLGRIGDGEARRHLETLVRDRGALAGEAALALGTLRATAAADTLVACANDRFADATLRAAAATSAVRVGRHREVAEVVRGVLLASTPAGRELQARLGLPDKPRWAYERYLIQRMQQQEAPELPMFDTDAPWSELERAADRLTAWLLQER